MTKKPKRLWFITAVIFLAAGAALAFYHRSHAAARLDGPVYVMLALAAGWLGAFAGGLVDWLRYRRSPLEPFFAGRFKWHYRQRYWLRFALVFSGAWLLFVMISVLVALFAGAYGEARTFFTIRGIAAVLLFVVVFGLEGAMVGGLVDLAGYLTRRKTHK